MRNVKIEELQRGDLIMVRWNDASEMRAKVEQHDQKPEVYVKDLGEEAINIDAVKPDPDKPIIETVGKNLKEALELLSRVGLNDAYLFVRRYGELSDGQRYRYRIAKLIESGKQYWLMDEFCATLDRETAKVVAFNVQKQARRTGKAVIAATTHTDLVEYLAPSVHIHKGWENASKSNTTPTKQTPSVPSQEVYA